MLSIAAPLAGQRELADQADQVVRMLNNRTNEKRSSATSWLIFIWALKVVAT